VYLKENDVEITSPFHPPSFLNFLGDMAKQPRDFADHQDFKPLNKASFTIPNSDEAEVELWLRIGGKRR
jgi:hypothetical protein